MSLIEVFFLRFFFSFLVGERGGAVVICSHTVDVKILCTDVVRPSGCPFSFLVSMPYLVILSK